MLIHPFKALLAISLLVFATCSISEASAPEGLRKAYYPSGQIESEKTYSGGLLNGPSRIYYENGQLAWEGRFLNGKVDGISKFYYESGKLQAERTYFDGVQTGKAKLYTPEGKQLALFNIENGLKHGDAFYYYQSGAVLKKETYVHGVKEGPEAIFTRDGAVKSMLNYRNGLLVASSSAKTGAPVSKNKHDDQSKKSTPPAPKAVNTKPKIPTPEELLKAAARTNSDMAISPKKLSPSASEPSKKAEPSAA